MHKLTSFLVFFILVKESLGSPFYDVDFGGADIFGGLKVDTYATKRGERLWQLNDYLVDRTKSTDPDENLDIVLEKYLADLKRTKPYYSEMVQVERLLLSLRTIKGANECTYYAYRILSANLGGLGTKVESIVTKQNLRRVDKILTHYVEEYLKNCKDVELKNFDETLKNLDKVLMKRLDVLLELPIKQETSENLDRNRGKNYLERILSAISNYYNIRPSQIYNTMMELVKDDPDLMRFLKPIENERTGVPKISRDMFDEIYMEYIDKPCKYFRMTFGPNVFELAGFRDMFDSEKHTERVDFYEFWLKYNLCKLDIYDGSRSLVVYYAENNKDIL